MIKVITLKDLATKLKSEKSIALFCHIRPDGDTLGSALAFKKGFLKFNIKVDVFCDDVIPEKFFYNSAFKEIKRDLKEEYSCYCAIDSGDINRLGKFGNIFIEKKNTFNIDHHISNTRYAKFNYVLDNASNCENIYELLTELNVDINKEISNLLAIGVVTDTGGFKHKNVTPNTLTIASNLVKSGADLNEITYNMFNKQSKARALLFGNTMKNIKFYLDDRFAIATVFNKDLISFNAKPEDTEGFIDFVMGIDTVLVGVCLMELEGGKIKASFRSKGVNVNEIAGLFGGGGHVLASGCQFNNIPYEEVVDTLVSTLKRYLPN